MANDHLTISITSTLAVSCICLGSVCSCGIFELAVFPMQSQLGGVLVLVCRPFVSWPVHSGCIGKFAATLLFAARLLAGWVIGRRSFASFDSSLFVLWLVRFGGIEVLRHFSLGLLAGLGGITSILPMSWLLFLCLVRLGSMEVLRQLLPGCLCKQRLQRNTMNY